MHKLTYLYEPYSVIILERRDNPVVGEGSGPTDKGNTDNVRHPNSHFQLDCITEFVNFTENTQLDKSAPSG